MDPVAALQASGGSASHADLLALTSRSALATACRRGEVVRVARGRYALPSVPPDRRAAVALGGVLSHASAAAAYGWPVLRRLPVHVTVPPGRRLPEGAVAALRASAEASDVGPGRRGAGPSGAGPSGAGRSGAGPSGAGPSSAGPSGAGPSGPGRRGARPSGARPSGAGPNLPGIVVHRGPVSDGERASGCTSMTRTVLDCATALPPVDALAVADSALRSGDLEPIELREAAAARPGRGSRRRSTVVRWADARAANPFESALRACLRAAAIHSFTPQVVVTGPGFFACVDLADCERRIAVEADGRLVHGRREQFVRDLRRHDELAVLGWLTLRFAWDQVINEPAWVVGTVRAAVERRTVQNSTRW